MFQAILALKGDELPLTLSNLKEDPVLNTDLLKGKDRIRSDTPNTYLTDFTNKPDITILCEKCQPHIYVKIQNIKYHQKYHKSLETLYYFHPAKPENTETLLQRRNEVIRRVNLQSSLDNPVTIQEINKINEAYELLKSELEDVYESMKAVREKIQVQVESMGLDSSPDCVLAVGICSSSNKRWKSSMEDVKVYQDYFGEDRNKCYLAVFDGYHGNCAADRCGYELHRFLLEEMSKFDSLTKSTIPRDFSDWTLDRHSEYESRRPDTRESFRVNLHQDSSEIVQDIFDSCNEKYELYIKEKADEEEEKKIKRRRNHPLSEKMKQAFKRSYHLMDILLSYGKGERSRVRWSGSSACTVVVQNTSSQKSTDSQDDMTVAEDITLGEEVDREAKQLGLVHLANLGNTHAILIRGNKSYRITKDHTPNNQNERERILRMGGTLSSSERYCKVNGVLPVTRGLGNHGDVKLKQCVTVNPHVKTVPIDEYAQALVIASNGLWDMLSDEEITCLITEMLPSEQIKAPSRVSDCLLPLFNESVNHSKISSTENKTNDDFNEKHEDKVLTKDETIDETEDLTKDLSEEQTKDLSYDQIKEQTKEQNNYLTNDQTINKNKIEEFENFKNSSIIDNAIKNENNDDSNERNQKIMMKNENEENDTINDGLDNNSNSSNQKIVNSQTNREEENQNKTFGEIELKDPDNISELNDEILEPKSTVKERNSEQELHIDLSKAMAEKLTHAALMAGSKDNITCMVVLLPGSFRDHSTFL